MAGVEELGDVGSRLRALRHERGATLAELAETTGISVSTLSRLESGQRRPTLELLLPLARAHRVTLDELVDAPETADPRVALRPVRRFGATVIPLSRRPGGLQSYKIVYPAGWPGADPELKVHEGYEWVYVLAGTLHLRLGAQRAVLRPGEVVEFDTRVPHAFANPGREAAEVISVFGPQGERMHLRTRPTGEDQPE